MNEAEKQQLIEEGHNHISRKEEEMPYDPILTPLANTFAKRAARYVSLATEIIKKGDNASEEEKSYLEAFTMAITRLAFEGKAEEYERRQHKGGLLGQIKKLFTERRRYYDRDIPEEKQIGIFNNKDYWQGITSDYEGGILSKEREELRIDYYETLAGKISKNFNGPSRVLEVGCGLGFVVKALKEMGVKAVGIDVSQWATDHAVTPISVGNVLNLPFKDKSFKVVFSHDLLEHIPISNLPKAISELDRVGRGNYHIISCGSLPNDRDITHVTMHPIKWWRRHLPKGWIVEEKG